MCFVAIVQCKDREIIGIVQKKVAKKRLSFFLQKVTKNPLQMLQKVTKFASKTLQKVTAMIFKRKIFSEIDHWKKNCHKEALN